MGFQHRGPRFRHYLSDLITRSISIYKNFDFFCSTKYGFMGFNVKDHNSGII